MKGPAWANALAVLLQAKIMVFLYAALYNFRSEQSYPATPEDLKLESEHRQ